MSEGEVTIRVSKHEARLILAGLMELHKSQTGNIQNLSNKINQELENDDN